jgi:hypothetical protein
MAVIAVDFDGTLCEHKFPEIGDEVGGAFRVLRSLQAAGHKLILWTMRSNGQECGPVLDLAVNWCRVREMEFWAVNENPEQASWTSSRKVYANLYIDDAAMGCPTFEMTPGGRPVVDWVKVQHALIRNGYLARDGI